MAALSPYTTPSKSTGQNRKTVQDAEGLAVSLFNVLANRRQVSTEFWRAVILPLELSRLGLDAVRMLGDGNCLYRAVAHGLAGNADKHEEIRAAVVATVRADIDHFGEVYAPNGDHEPANIEEAIKEMEQASTLGIGNPFSCGSHVLPAGYSCTYSRRHLNLFCRQHRNPADLCGV